MRLWTLGGTRWRVFPVLAIALCLSWNQPSRGESEPSSRFPEFFPSLLPSQKPLILDTVQEVLLSQAVPLSPTEARFGGQISLNGRTLSVAWSQQPLRGTIRTGIADVGLMQAMGVELLSTWDTSRQPVQWFSLSQTEAQSLVAWSNGQYRYLDVTDFASRAGWQLSIDGNILKISTQAAQVAGVRLGKQDWGDRVVVELNLPTPWRVTWVSTPTKTPTPDDPTKPTSKDTPDDPTKPAAQPSPQKSPPPTTQEWLISLDAQIDATWLQQAFEAGTQLKSLKIESAGNQTNLRINIPLGWRPQVFTLGNPNRLVIDIRPDSLIEKDIIWAPGVRWRQQYENLGTARFPVVWLEVNPRQSGIRLRPLLSNPPTDRGSAPLLETAELSKVAAAINAGFFNRIDRLALGAIRRDHHWLSGPILNRGAIAWNDAGEIKIGRLSLEETAIASSGARLAVAHLNSAYVQAGIGRYTPDWGTTYTPLSDGEMIVTVEGDRVTNQVPGGDSGKTSFPIPANGYVLALRSNQTAANQLPVGTGVRVESTAVPADFNRFPYILGGGPVLVQNGQIVLDPKAEGFSEAYVKQTAIRSAVGRNAAGNFLIAAVHNRAGGAGPTFAELAQIMQQLGAVDALNFDGGSSTSLYLGGELLDRPAPTAARVHNALGVFLQP